MVDSEEALTFIMDYVEENNYIINCVYDSMGQDELKRFFVKDFNDIILSLIEQAEECYGKKLNDGYKTFLSTFYVDATAGILIDWVKDRNRHNREVYIEYIKNRILTLQLSIFDFETHTQNIIPKEKLEEALKQVEVWKGEIISRLQDYEAFRYDYKQNWNLNYNDYDGKLVYN